MIKKNSLLVIMLLTANMLFAQEKVMREIDSLKTELSKIKNDSDKAKLLSKICERYWSVNPPEGLQYGHQSLELAKKMNWKSEIADAYGVLGMNHSLLSNNDSAVIYLKQSIQLAEESGNLKQIALACRRHNFWSLRTAATHRTATNRRR